MKKVQMSNKYVFFLGGTKSATSSIYRYLGDHPEITPSLQKQANFFLENRVEQDSAASNGVGIADREFIKCFPSKNGSIDRILLDVSPDYFNSENARHGLVQFLANKQYQLFVIVRNPIERLVSWYQFGQQIGLVPDNIDFKEYVNKQDSASDNAAISALSTGRFIHYLDLWRGQFPNDKLKILRFDALTMNSSETMASVATTLGISPEFYEDYEFYNHNKTQKVKFRWIQWLYLLTQRSIRGWISGSEFLNRNLAPFFFQGSKIYRKLNAENTKNFLIDKAMKEYLENYYEAELKYLGNDK